MMHVLHEYGAAVNDTERSVARTWVDSRVAQNFSAVLNAAAAEGPFVGAIIDARDGRHRSSGDSGVLPRIALRLIRWNYETDALDERDIGSIVSDEDSLRVTI